MAENNLRNNAEQENNEKYLQMVFSLLKKRENIILSDIETHFGNTELRLLFEVLTAKYEGKRLISTQLAKILGVTRSAVSQIVDRLEKDGVVQRVADDVDRKIAYIELTEKTLETYEGDLKKCQNFINRVVDRFGKDNFCQMVELFEGFVEAINQEKKSGAYTRK